MTSNDDNPPSPDCDCAPADHEYGVHAPGHRLVGAEQPPGAYPVEDLAGMSPSSAALLLRRAAVEAEAEVETRQHVVITRDVDTGHIAYSGPFPTGLEALTVAQRIVEQSRTGHARQRFTVSVSPLHPL